MTSQHNQATTLMTQAQAAENRRIARITAREHNRRIRNLVTAGATPEEIARVQRSHDRAAELRALAGGSARVRRVFGTPFAARCASAAKYEPFPTYEQLPPVVEARFVSQASGFGPLTQMYINNRPVGRPLGDHGRAEGFRWHNALHLAFAVGLGWSPVTRSMLGVERLSDPYTANVEDGHAAREAEERTAWAIFLDARSHGWYTRVHPSKSLLRQVRTLTAGLEVSGRSNDDWRSVITAGIDCVRHLWSADGGTLYGDSAVGALAPVTSSCA
ncbi:hypothetical protein [Nonomuraea sp. NPDC023979]|uniref:hypothetical protein n=1 Tax=Nonomuraea sp. NPDC023979 TaxID=3154796 RepID=UPI0033EF6404